VSSSALLMDRIYRQQRHVYDLSRKYYLLGRDRLIDGLAPPPGGRVLEIGCGTARNLAAVAARHPGVQLYGIDISSEMLISARRTLERRGLSAQVRVARADATSFDPAILFGVPSFSRIFFSYTLSMIPEWERALAEAVQWLQPDGELHLVDFGGQERLPAWFRSGLRRWLAAFHVAPRDGLAAALAGLPIGVRLFERSHRGYAQYAICRRLTGWVPMDRN